MNDVLPAQSNSSIAKQDKARTNATAKPEPSTGNVLPQVSTPTASEAPAQVKKIVEKAVASLNEYAQTLSRDLQFTIDEELGRPVVRVYDSDSSELIRQIPNDTVLSLARKLNALVQENEARELSAKSTGANDGASSSANSLLNLIDIKV